MKKSLNTREVNDKMLFTTIIDGYQVKYWINYMDWKISDDYTKKREVEYLEWMKYGRKTN